MPTLTNSKELSESTLSVDDVQYQAADDDQIFDVPIVLESSGTTFDFAVQGILYVQVKNVKQFDDTIIYSLGTVTTDRSKNIKKANDLLSEDQDIDLDLSY